MNRAASIFIIGSLSLSALVTTRAVATDAEDVEAAQAAARESIRANEAFAHVRFLASDALGGRDTPSDGLKIAAQYAAALFESWGLEPVGDDGTYFQKFELAAVAPTASSGLGWSSARGEGRVDLTAETATPFPFTPNGKVTAPVVFCGYGITAEDQGYDDYAGIDVEGKIALILRYTPREKDTEQYFGTPAGRRHAYFQTKYDNAIAHGAAGVLVVTGPLHHDADNFVFSWPSSGGRGRGSDGGAPGMHVAQATLDRMLGTVGLGMSELKSWQAAIDESMKPRSRAIDGLKATVDVTMARSPLPTKNVIGVVRGTDPNLRDEVIVVGGHYDHVGIGGGGADRIHNGADDNASGSSGVLEIAQAFATSPLKPRRTLVFMLFAGEEKGLLGARHYVRNPVFPIEKTVAMINLDMIGRNATDDVEVIGAFQNKDLSALAKRANRTVGMKLTEPQSISGGSDHMPFISGGVPAVFFFSGFHREYHQPGDHAELINREKLEKISRLAFNCAWELAMSDWWPERPQARDGGGRRPRPEGGGAPTPTPTPAKRGPRNPKAKLY